jgi:predicted metal-binding membrane protein
VSALSVPARAVALGGVVARPRPTRAVEGLILVAWLAALWPAAGHASMTSAWGPGATGAVTVAAALPMWGGMTVAMMLPGALPALRHVAHHSLRRRRRRAMAEFLGVYLVGWTLAGGGLLAALAWTRPDRGVVLPLALAAAAGYQLSPAKRRALQRCHRSAPLPPSGPRATRGVARFAALNATGCLASCWALMLVMTLAPAAQPAWMLGLTAAITAEKRAERPRAIVRAGALALAALAAGATVLAVAG